MLNTNFAPWPAYTNEEAEAVTAVLLSNKVNYWTGKECRHFEQEFADWCGTKYAVAVANGTVAIDLALKALNVGIGAEVIVTSRTFIASVSCIVTAGAKPIFVDVDINTQNMAPHAIAAAISPKTRAIICVHLAGYPCAMDDIMQIANKHGLYVIEDCAQAHGARYKGSSVGSIGHIGAWSFCQDKIMTTGGEGGMVTTNNSALWSKIWSYKDHGKSWEAVYAREHAPGFRWLHEHFGTNWRMTEMQAAIGRIQLRRMPLWHQQRLTNAKTIWEQAKLIPGLRVPELGPDVEHAAYKCYVFVMPEYLKSNWNRERIIQEINALGVPCYSGSCSEVYLEQAFDNTSYRPIERLKNAKELGETSLMFLVHPNISASDITRTCDVLSMVMQQAILGI
ncbi:aminotransferase [Achromatium sp. WMS2]|nr:aminotransferase [Achromatium sp. WMS2]